MLSEYCTSRPSRVPSQKAMPSFSSVEEARTGERDVQLLGRVRGEEREVEVETARALHREVALQLGKVAVAGDVLQLDRAVPADVERVGEPHVAAAAPAVARALPDGERVGPRRDVVVEAVAREHRPASQRVRVARARDEQADGDGAGDAHADAAREAAHRFARYSSSQRRHAATETVLAASSLPGA